MAIQCPHSVRQEIVDFHSLRLVIQNNSDEEKRGTEVFISLHHQNAINIASPHTDISVSVSCMIFYVLYATALQKGACLSLSAQLSFMCAKNGLHAERQVRNQPRTEKIHVFYLLYYGTRQP